MWPLVELECAADFLIRCLIQDYRYLTARGSILVVLVSVDVPWQLVGGYTMHPVIAGRDAVAADARPHV